MGGWGVCTVEKAPMGGRSLRVFSSNKTCPKKHSTPLCSGDKNSLPQGPDRGGGRRGVAEDGTGYAVSMPPERCAPLMSPHP